MVELTARVVAGNCSEADPCGIVIVAGRVSTVGSLLVSVTVIPPAGATLLIPTWQVPFSCPPTKGLLFRKQLLNSGNEGVGSRVRSAVIEGLKLLFMLA